MKYSDRSDVHVDLPNETIITHNSPTIESYDENNAEN